MNDDTVYAFRHEGSGTVERTVMLTEGERQMLESDRACTTCYHHLSFHWTHKDGATGKVDGEFCFVPECRCRAFTWPDRSLTPLAVADESGRKNAGPMSSGDREVMDAALVAIVRTSNRLLAWSGKIKGYAIDGISHGRPATDIERRRMFESWAAIVEQLNIAAGIVERETRNLGVEDL